MFDDLLSINFMLIILLAAFVSVLALNIITTLISFVLSRVIKAKKL